MRNGRAIALGLAVALLLSGCDVAGSLVTKTGLELGLQKLTSELEQVQSVSGVEPIAKLEGDYSYGVDLRVTVLSLVEADVQEIVQLVNGAFATVPFTGLGELSFNLVAGDGSQFSQYYPLLVPTDQLAEELHYWIELGRAFGGPLTLTLYEYPADYVAAEPYIRSIFALDDTLEPDWDALRAVPDTSSARRTWYISGLSIDSEWPTDALLDLRDRVAEIELVDDGVLAVESYSADYISVNYFSPQLTNPDSPTTSSTWPQVLEAVQLVVDSGFPHTAFTYYGLEDVTSSAHLGACEVTAETAPSDRALWEALAASNIALPAGSGPGWCVNA